MKYETIFCFVSELLFIADEVRKQWLYILFDRPWHTAAAAVRVQNVIEADKGAVIKIDAQVRRIGWGPKEREEEKKQTTTNDRRTMIAEKRQTFKRLVGFLFLFRFDRWVDRTDGRTDGLKGNNMNKSVKKCYCKTLDRDDDHVDIKTVGVSV